MPAPDDLRPIEWRSYEKLVAGISADVDNVEVEHQYDLELDTGGIKEVDVMIWDDRGEETETIMVECRYYDSNLAQDNVDSMVGLLSQSSVDQAVIITKTGFQSGAVERAEGLRDNSDYTVDLFELRFYDEENDFEKTINELQSTIYMPNPEVNILEVQSEAINKDAEGTEFEFRLSRFQSPNIVTETGDPTGEKLFDLWYPQIEETYSQNSSQVLEDRETVTIESEATFDDTYVSDSGAIYRIDSIEYEMVITPQVVHQTSSRLEDEIFDQYDMVLIDALSRERDYIDSEEALSAFLSSGA